ncbi:MAG: trehalase family glycosidase [Candidatus Hydrogenedentota bacterium]
MLLSIQVDPGAETCLPELEVVGEEPGDQAERVIACSDCWVALVQSEGAPIRSFAIAISYTNEDEARERARKTLVSDINAVIEARLRFYAAVPLPIRLTATDEPVFYKALSVIKVNFQSAQDDIPCRWTTPDRMPHRRMWLWDSAFHAVGARHISSRLGEEAIYALFTKQQSDGKLALAVHPGKIESEEYDTQPPIVAWAVWKQFQHSENQEFLERVYDGLVQYLHWFEQNRRNANGLYGWHVRSGEDPIRGARGGESGMDNSPRFDNVTAMTAVDLCSYLAAEYLVMKKIAKQLGYAGDVAKWHRRQQAIIERANELLWDDEDRFYYDLDEHGDPLFVKTPAGLLALHGRLADHDRAEALRTHLTNPTEFWSFFPVPTVARDQDSFSHDMWRGPTWLNINLLLFYALEQYGFLEEARLLARMTIDEVARWYRANGCIYEYYDCLGETAPAEMPRKGTPGTAGGAGLGVIADYHWSAAAVIDLLYAIC